MKKITPIVCLFILILPATAQQRVTDKELASVVWAMGQMYPDGFTLSLDSLRQPTKGIVVSYYETQNMFDKKNIPAVIKHARAHENLVGGWFNAEEGKYYPLGTTFRTIGADSRMTVKLGRECSVIAVGDASFGTRIQGLDEKTRAITIMNGLLGVSLPRTPHVDRRHP